MDFLKFFEYAQIEELNSHLADINVDVTVWCPTYNHGKYIKYALDGFVSQITEYTYQVVIFDDASNDGAAEIIKEYALKYPNIIHAFLAKVNTYRQKVRFEFGQEFRKKYFTGRYIALCEGDDCWIDNRKLQIQVDYMEKHSDCSMYLHNAIWYYCDNNQIKTGNPYKTQNGTKKLSVEECIMHENGHPPTASFMYRIEYDYMPDFFWQSSVTDHSTQLFMTTKGYVFYDDRIMSVYRSMVPGGYGDSSRKNISHEVFFSIGWSLFLVRFDRYTQYAFHETIRARVQQTLSIFFEKIDKKIGLNEYIRISRLEGFRIPNIPNELISDMEELKLQIEDVTYLGESLYRFCRNHSNLWIMGTGTYSEIVSSQLDNNGIKINGYIVSKKNNNDVFREKPVVQIDEIKDENIGLIIAINPLNYDEILNSVSKAGIRNYYNPYYFDWRINDGFLFEGK